MTRQRTAPIPPTDPNPVNLARLPAMADHVLAGDVVQPASVLELCAPLRGLQQLGYELKHRTEWERRTPWLFLVVPMAQKGN